MKVRITLVDGKPKAEVLDDAGKASAAELALPDGVSVEDVGALRRAYEDEKDRRRKAMDRLAQFDGIDDAAAARDALDKIKAGGLKTTKEVEEYRKQLEEKFSKDSAELKTKADAYEAQIRDLTFGNEARDALAKTKGNSTLLMPVLKDRIKWVRDDKGKLAMRVVDGDGREMVTRKSGSTDPMGLSELVETLKADSAYAGAFEGSGVGGAGTHRATGEPGRGGHDLTNLSPEARLAAYHEARGA